MSNYQLNDKQIEIINAWLDEAYRQGYLAGQKTVENEEEAEEFYYPIHNCIMDISAFQKNPDFDEICDKCDFVILRARVCNKNDTTFVERAKELNKRNMPFAVYDYATLMSNSNAVAQAEALYKLASPYNPKIYYIDTEQLGTGVTYGAEREYIKTYVARLRELGAKVIGQYTGDWKYSTYYWQIQDLFDTLWIASYGKNIGTYDGVVLKSAEKTDKIDLHQFTDKGILPGIATKGDLSRLTGNKSLEWFTGRKYE